MVAPRSPDLTSGNFQVLVDGMPPMIVTTVSGLGFELMVLEDHEAMSKPGWSPHRKPGVEKHGVVTISTVELEKAALLGQWRDKCEQGTIERKQVTIIMHDSAQVPLQTFVLQESWPSAIQINSVPQAGAGWIQVDVTLAHEGIERTRG